MTDREQRLDLIRSHADYLTDLARQYDRLRYCAEHDASDAFLNLAESAGRLTRDNLRQLATLLEILMDAGKITGDAK